MVWFAWQRLGREAEARMMRFEGDRRAVRRQAVEMALRGLLDVCGD
jgi:nicotinamide-nucleotide amidase